MQKQEFEKYYKLVGKKIVNYFYRKYKRYYIQEAIDHKDLKQLVKIKIWELLKNEQLKQKSEEHVKNFIQKSIYHYLSRVLDTSVKKQSSIDLDYLLTNSQKETGSDAVTFQEADSLLFFIKNILSDKEYVLFERLYIDKYTLQEIGQSKELFEGSVSPKTIYKLKQQLVQKLKKNIKAYYRIIPHSDNIKTDSIANIVEENTRVEEEQKFKSWKTFLKYRVKKAEKMYNNTMRGEIVGEVPEIVE